MVVTIRSNPGASNTMDTGLLDPLPAKSRTGAFYPSGSATLGTSGMWQGLVQNIAVGTGAFNAVQVSSAGVRGRWQTGTTINSICGSRISPVNTERDLNPWTEWKLQLSAATTVRTFLGFMSSASAPVSAADYGANLSVVAFWQDSSVDGNWHIMQNSGAASSNTTTINN